MPSRASIGTRATVFPSWILDRGKTLSGRIQISADADGSLAYEHRFAGHAYCTHIFTVPFRRQRQDARAAHLESLLDSPAQLLTVHAMFCKVSRQTRSRRSGRRILADSQ